MILSEQEKTVIFDKCVAFLNHVGIPTFFRSINHDSFLPGFLIENGTLVIDKDALQYPGDILHEAGHIAVVPAADRPRLSEGGIIKRRNREAEEVMAIAWSYAACMHLEIDPAYVFHADGYRGGSSSIMESCDKNEYVGMLMLKSVGMAAADNSLYPQMAKWLRD
ncbi:hypothetical protein SAMN05428949_5570 [Chitinophaga sp. YR627]|uniref:hypothetical protein n=1 Tax=Chitinophaga sp. YR627 TaxID=1881041 RepID=UPI0008E84325|nr:hypothetical protein [Chitinophaga sp. YR627]SFO52481.1 hypothetical protein SAMN05428949_5570 [Chitinophaga sp. YR627]